VASGTFLTSFDLTPVSSSSTTALEILTSHDLAHVRLSWGPTVYEPSWLKNSLKWFSDLAPTSLQCPPQRLFSCQLLQGFPGTLAPRPYGLNFHFDPGGVPLPLSTFTHSQFKDLTTGLSPVPNATQTPHEFLPLPVLQAGSHFCSPSCMGGLEKLPVPHLSYDLSSPTGNCWLFRYQPTLLN
jgi:hypothetical protein